ncbi:hypothetical protein [Sphingosinithalassobacter portus]|uniref:hypothetical protein n=1 Tax=Stakelama portus TaxID=2676234 RepID=UPI000D6DE36E|nr:hypothetical protein [Sphingosinithalassobacter portus]
MKPPTKSTEMRTGPAVALMLACLLAACGSSDDDNVGGITASEARELNEAAAVLDVNASDVAPIANAQ